ncbi:MAG TPA: peptide-methionine (S)-S-oxide reductase MsrA [Verrucomicrobiae bacterium]|nr:peptide-methionine (S)-S-oxide reductase MsrA [Verrucomicrobiae bacterium]
MTRSIKFPLVILVAGVAIFAAVAWSGAGGAAKLPDPKVDENAAKGKETVVLAGGCFWGIQAVFEHVKGVTSATAGYSGGTVKTPGYEEVSSGTTGHAESVEVVYDPSQVTFGQLLKVFFSVAHDPTELNRQGPDFGTQYRSAIFFTTQDQERIARAYVDQLTAAKTFPNPIVTQIMPMKGFYRAEDYHQDYAVHHPDNPYIMINDLPKVANLKKEFPQIYVNR